MAGNHLRCESFVQFDQIDLCECESLPFEQCSHGGNWTNAHDLRSNTANLVIHDPGLRFRVESLYTVFTQYDNGRGAVSYA